eukprot:COSAG01_NODE_35741_length_527_cov_1.058411_1_plen_43_part_10
MQYATTVSVSSGPTAAVLFSTEEASSRRLSRDFSSARGTPRGP